jgi:hypothetical protein
MTSEDKKEDRKAAMHEANCRALGVEDLIEAFALHKEAPKTRCCPMCGEKGFEIILQSDLLWWCYHCDHERESCGKCYGPEGQCSCD